MNATNTTKYENTGVIILVADDAILNNAPVNSGVIFDFINNGINVGAKYVHFVDIDVTNKLEINITKNETIIRTINDKSIVFTRLNKFTVITLPIFVYLNNATNCDAKNTRTSISPIPFKLLVNSFITSLSSLTCFVVIPYTIEQIIIARETIYNIPLTNGEFAPNNLFIYKSWVLSSNEPDNGSPGIIEYIKNSENEKYLKITICDETKSIFNSVIRKLKQIKNIDVLDVSHMSRKVIKKGSEDINIEYYYTEISLADVDKWVAIQYLSKKLNIDNENIIAIRWQYEWQNDDRKCGNWNCHGRKQS